jgi:hypothetical protein
MCTSNTQQNNNNNPVTEHGNLRIQKACIHRTFRVNLHNQVIYTVQNAWRTLHFVMRIVKKGNKNAKCLVYTPLVRPILEYGTACWDPYRECQISALDFVQNKPGKLAHQSGG